MISAIDRYILRTAVASTVVAIAVLCGLYVVVDAFGKLQDFLTGLKTWNAVLPFMLRYYSLHFPIIFADIAPLGVLVGLLLALARLERHNELLAVQACGMSLRRLAVPLIALCLFVTGLLYADKQWITPALADEIQESEKIVLRRTRRPRILKDLFLRDSAGVWFVVGKYDPAILTCFDTWIIVTVKGDRKVFYANKATLEEKGLRIETGTALTKTGPQPLKDHLISTNLCADDLIARASHMKLRSYTNLLWILRRNPSARDVAVMLHRNLAFPLVAVFIPLIGMSVMLIREGTGALSAGGIAILLCVGYFVLDDVCCEIARQGYLSPVMGGWMPAGIFSAAGVYLFTRARV